MTSTSKAWEAAAGGLRPHELVSPVGRGLAWHTQSRGFDALYCVKVQCCTPVIVALRWADHSTSSSGYKVLGQISLQETLTISW